MTIYKNIDTEKLVNMWCYNSNDEECKKIEKELRVFKDDAKKSAPFYVSTLAFYYAFYEELSEHEETLLGKDED